MATTGGTDTVDPDEKLERFELLLLIKDTFLGSRKCLFDPLPACLHTDRPTGLLGSCLMGSTEHSYGIERGNILMENIEGMADEGDIGHDESCPAYDGHEYEYFRDQPCNCNRGLHGSDELLALLPRSKRTVVSFLVEHGSDMLNYLFEGEVGPHNGIVYHALGFSQKLDEATLPICRDLAKKANSSDEAKAEARDVFAMLVKARNAIKPQYRPVRNVCFFHSLACLDTFHYKDTSSLVESIVTNPGLPYLPDEMVLAIKDSHDEAKSKMVSKAYEDYWVTLRNRHYHDSEA